MPVYEKCKTKIAARDENILLYQRLTGLDKLPEDKGYWTLCNHQTDDKDSEIEQMQASGLISKSQFFGVDRDAEIISSNKLYHPDANWISAEWLDAIEMDCFNPAFIYLDTTSFADHSRATDLTIQTLFRCDVNTLLIVNVMLNDPRSSRRFDEKALIKNLNNHVPARELRTWKSEILNYIYSATGKTDMLSCVFFKESK